MSERRRPQTLKLRGKHRSLYIGRRPSSTLAGLEWWTYGVWFYGKGPFLPGQRREFTLEWNGRGKNPTAREFPDPTQVTVEEEGARYEVLEAMGLTDEEEDTDA